MSDFSVWLGELRQDTNVRQRAFHEQVLAWLDVVHHVKARGFARRHERAWSYNRVIEHLNSAVLWLPQVTALPLAVVVLASATLIVVSPFFAALALGIAFGASVGVVAMAGGRGCGASGVACGGAVSALTASVKRLGGGDSASRVPRLPLGAVENIGAFVGDAPDAGPTAVDLHRMAEESQDRMWRAFVDKKIAAEVAKGCMSASVSHDEVRRALPWAWDDNEFEAFARRKGLAVEFPKTQYGSYVFRW